MPLLRRQTFKKIKPPPDLRLDEEVFHCPLTNEIFRDYEEFFNRIILCNSLVWSCSLTGRAGLTYQEAVESEQRAQKQLASMPESLIKPVLYLAKLTHRTRLHDMNDDVFVYAKDRFFTGELVEVVHKGDRRTCKILRVVPPSAPVEKLKEENDCIVISDSDESVKEPEKPKIVIIDPQKYKYEVKDKRTGTVIITKVDQIFRRKGLFTRDKCKLFLKQNCDSQGSGIWKVKGKTLRKYKLTDAKFESFFAGPMPGFTISQVKPRPSSSKEDALIKKHKQQLKDKKKYKKEVEKKLKEKDLTAMSEKAKATMTAEERAELKEQVRVAREAEKQERRELAKKKLEEDRQKKKEEREKRREEEKQKAEHLKEWSRPRDDMECDDLKDLPTPTPLNTALPLELFGDTMQVLEFMNLFKDIIDAEGVMPPGLTIDTLGKALLDSDSNGMYAEVLMYLLMAVFCLQEEEEEEEELQDEDAIAMKLPEGFDDGVNMADVSMKDIIKAATVAAQWPQLNFGKSIRKLQMDSFTVTEILRLHLLSSGANVTENNAKFRFQQRGGFTCSDDAGLEFLMEEPAIVKVLGVTNVYDLTPAMKLKILTLLVRQLLTFVGCRDHIEDSQDKLKQLRNDLRQHQYLVQRRERDETTFWYKKRLEERAKQKEADEQLKEQKKKVKEERLRVEEIRKDHWLKAREEGKDLKTYLEEHKITLPELPPEPELPANPPEKEKKVESSPPKEEEHKKEPERKSSRKKGKEDENPLFDLSVETVDWDKVSPSDRSRMKQMYQEKEQQLQEAIVNIQQSSALYTIGRDRTYRKYWAFSTMPGLFVEDDDQYISDDVLQPVEQKPVEPFDSDTLPLIHLKAKEKGAEEKGGSDKENESFDGNTAQGPVLNGISDNSLDNSGQKQQNGAGPIDSMDTNEKVEETLASPFTNVLDQIKMRGQIKWSFYNTSDQVDKLIDNLNPRGYREGPLRQMLNEHKNMLVKCIAKCPVDLLCVSQGNKVETSKGAKSGITYQSIKSHNKTTQGMAKNDSARELMELNFRESLLDLEERLYVGGVGQLKIKDRKKWKYAIENGSYDPQVEQLTWSDKTEEVSAISSQSGKSSTDNSMEVAEDSLPVIRDLAKALLQISQMVFDKYLNPPLGDSEDAKKAKLKAALEAAFSGKKEKSKGKKDAAGSDSEDDTEMSTPRNQKTPRARWEESLLTCSSMSQLFLHLTTLEQCLAWSKSALHACCRICRRKGDAEKMLLCDGCDRGHHMYCLKPPVKKIPAGDWFCPNCRPKEMKPRTPRKRRKSFMEEQLNSSSSEEEDEDSSEEDEDESDDEADSSEVEGDSDENEDEDTDDEDNDTEIDTEEEEDPQPAKIKFQTPIKKSAKAKASTVKASNKSSSKQSPPSRPNSRAGKGRQSLEPAQDKPTKGRNSARNSLENGKPSTSKPRASLEKPKQSGRSSARNSLEPERPSSRQGGRASLGKSEPNKRKRDGPEEEGEPSIKKVTSKSRGGDWADQMKQAENLVNELMKHPDAWPFLKPVTKKDAPDYLEIIDKPMDFSTIKANINKFQYKTAVGILEDIQLVFTNCQKYNLVTADVYKAGQRLVKVFVQRVKQLKLDDLIRQQCTANSDSASSKKSKRH